MKVHHKMFSILAMSAALGGSLPLPGGKVQPVKRCPECGGESRLRYCDGDDENRHPKRRRR